MRLDATALDIRYGSSSVVRNVDLAAAPGEILAILGANGSGKSTLLRALAGLLPYGGAVRWGGDPHAIGYMPQDTVIRAALTAFEVVLLGRLRSLTLHVSATDVDAACAAMAELGIAALASRRIGELSGGQRQLVFMAQVLAGNPRALLLDEPTSALDISHQLHVLTMLRDITRRRELTTVAVLHDLNAAARFADRIALMHNGSLIATGTPAEVLTCNLLRRAFAVEVSIQPGPDGSPVIVPMQVAAV